MADAATSVRVLLQRSGYSPIPVSGKIPALMAWQKHTATNADEIELWRKLFPDAVNTGILTRLNPTIDADILNEEAAEAIEGLAREFFSEHGPVLVRIGKAPKRAIVLRTDVPFPKMSRLLVAPNGAPEKIEVLCDGQQVVVAGIHPDTHHPYLWHGGDLGTTKHEELPYVRAEGLVAFLDAAVALLERDFGYTAAYRPQPKTTSGAGGAVGGRDWVDLIGNLLDGHELHDSTASLTSKLATAGMSNGAVFNVMSALFDRSAARGGDNGRYAQRLADLNRMVGTALTKFGKKGLQAAPECIEAVEALPIDGASIMVRPWITPGLLLRAQVTLLVAPPGSGKSLLTLQVAMMCARGTEWAGWKPRGCFRTLIINVEEDEDELRRRLHGARVKMEYEPDLRGVLIAKASSIVVATADSRTKTVTATPMLEEIVQTILTHHIDIVVVDPFAETFAGDENDNSELKWAAVLWRTVARRTNCAVVLVHHAKKYAQNMAGDMDAGRGGGSLAGVARIVATLFTMTEKEHEQMQPKDARGKDIERTRLLRFDDAKANHSLLSPTAKWFIKETVGIGNGVGSEPEDEVGVLVPWQAPDILDGLDSKAINEILNEIMVGTRAESGEPTGVPFCPTTKGGAKRWAGTLLQNEVPTLDAKGAQKLIDIWIRNELLLVDWAPIPNSKGKKVQCLRVNNANRPGVVSRG